VFSIRFLLLSWDAEEYGLIGSVEFAEKYEKLLLEQALVYLNLDVAVEGTDYFSLEGVPSLLDFFQDIAQEVVVNSTHTVYQAWTGGQEMGLLGR
jgi:N-acetylated-alpha-linked acidic dipeptidase